MTSSNEAASSGTARFFSWFERLLDGPLVNSWAIRWFAILLSALLFSLAVAVELGLYQQLIFAGACLLIILVVRRKAGRLATLLMIVLSVTISLRYMYWRITETLGFDSLLNAFFGYGLLLAELYALVMMLLGYFQTAWPLRRRPVPLPADVALWPTVDVFIPTYNEPLEVVRQSVLAALALDWPADRLKVYLLDDGRRPEFGAFCEQVGAGYLTRPDNRHAKAGNINAALEKTNGEFIVIFDCDHVTVRSFLQVCMGWFLKDKNLALIQTPHVFFSPDPFERNLGTFRNVPNEGDLFYGIIQDGNDLWNAAFFCGSCAVTRRSALLDVAGVATESVTEDALTALKMNRKGFNTAYLALPQAAGLATENLSRHIGQRTRWARGMAQIIRDNNPLFGRGLKIGQRLCYLSAMLHFFFGLPRLVFLTAPLAYLLFNAQVFQASAIMVAAYAIPHIVIASMTGSRIQGQFRHSFWNDVYESVLAWYIMRPALQTLISPRGVTFNVTSKGGVIEDAYFDWMLSRPYIVLLTLNLACFIVGLVTLAEGVSLDVFWTVVLNLGWTLYNILITGASVAVASEVRQLRASPRTAINLRAMVELPEGHTIACNLTDFSQGGLGLQLPLGVAIPHGTEVNISLFRNDEEAVFPTRVTFCRDGRLGVNFCDLTLEQESELVQMTFSRADAWTRTWGHNRTDTPFSSLKQVSGVGLRGIRLLTTQLSNRGRGALGSKAATSSKK